MLRKALATIAAATIVVTLAAPPADAKKGKKGKRDRHETMTIAPSIDGGIAGRARTCGYGAFMYDSNGMPYGPYCPRRPSGCDHRKRPHLPVPGRSDG